MFSLQKFMRDKSATATQVLVDRAQEKKDAAIAYQKRRDKEEKVARKRASDLSARVFGKAHRIPEDQWIVDSDCRLFGYAMRHLTFELPNTTGMTIYDEYSEKLVANIYEDRKNEDIRWYPGGYTYASIIVDSWEDFCAASEKKITNSIYTYSW